MKHKCSRYFGNNDHVLSSCIGIYKSLWQFFCSYMNVTKLYLGMCGCESISKSWDDTDWLLDFTMDTIIRGTYRYCGINDILQGNALIAMGLHSRLIVIWKESDGSKSIELKYIVSVMPSFFSPYHSFDPPPPPFLVSLSLYIYIYEQPYTPLY